MKRVAYIFCLFLITLSVVFAKDGDREFRGVWIATVDNINWPSKQGLSIEEQKKEFIDILDEIKSLNMNAVIMQVRPTAD
ncbi:MAG: family 10 glycosylhydrolase, partial [Cetobacterium sp.]